MFDRLRRRRKANANKPNPKDIPWDRHLARPPSTKESEPHDGGQDALVDEGLLSPSVDSPMTPGTPRTPDTPPTVKRDETAFTTNGEYYDQFLIRNNPHVPGTSSRSPGLNGDLIAPRATAPLRRSPVLRNTGTLRGMPLPPPKRTSIEAMTDGVDQLSLLPSEAFQPPQPSSQDIGMMGPRPTESKRKAEKPKSLNLRSSAFHTKSKTVYKREPASASITQDPKPPPSVSAITSNPPVAKTDASPMLSASSAPALGSKWRGEFMDLIPQFTVPRTAVPWRKKRPSNMFKTRKRFTSNLESTPDGRPLGANHISPPIMSNLMSNDPIPPAFLTGGTARSSQGMSPGTARSSASAVSAGQMSALRSTEIVVKKNARFELPVSSGKSLLFS